MRTLFASPLPFLLIAAALYGFAWTTVRGASTGDDSPQAGESFLAVPSAVPTQDICESGPGPRIVESNQGGPFVESPRSWSCVTLPDGSHALQSTP